MLSSLSRTQGARPAVLSLSNRAGTPRPQSSAGAVDKWPSRDRQAPSVSIVTPAHSTSAGSFSAKSRQSHGASSSALGKARISGVGNGAAQGRCKLSVQAHGATQSVAEQLRSPRCDNGLSSCVQLGSSGGLVRAPEAGLAPAPRPPAGRERGRAHQQQRRRSYSSKDGFGGGQHFPHSDQDSLGLFGGAQRKVIKPERIIIVRHGESLGNLDASTYVHVPDWKIPLTKKGFGDGQRAGEKIKEYIGDKPLFIYTSPYLRTKQTLAGMVEAFDTNYIVGVREEPRLTEQQFGNFQNLATIVNSKAERARFGRFYYRFPQGESGLDVYNRATSFIATMFRDFANENIARDDLNVIIVTHGLTMRLLVMRWFQYSIADFEATLNPENGSFVVMERKAKETTDSRFFDTNAEQRDLRHWYELTPESRAHINFREQRQFGSLWKLLRELPDEPGVVPEEFKNNPPKDSKDGD